MPANPEALPPPRRMRLKHHRQIQANQKAVHHRQIQANQKAVKLKRRNLPIKPHNIPAPPADFNALHNLPGVLDKKKRLQIESG